MDNWESDPPTWFEAAIHEMGQATGLRFTDDKIKAWWRYLRDVPERVLTQAIERWVTDRQEKPSIHGLRVEAGLRGSSDTRLPTRDELEAKVWAFYRDKALAGEPWRARSGGPERYAIDGFGGWDAFAAAVRDNEESAQERFTRATRMSPSRTPPPRPDLETHPESLPGEYACTTRSGLPYRKRDWWDADPAASMRAMDRLARQGLTAREIVEAMHHGGNDGT